MSATGDHETEKYVKGCLLFRLQRAEEQGLFFKSTDQFIHHLLNKCGLDDVCEEWIHRAPFLAICELLEEHTRKRQPGGPQNSDAQAVSPHLGGPYVAHPSNVSDSAYGPGPGSCMDDLRMGSPSKEPTFNVFFVSTAVLHAPPRPLTARIDPGRANNIIDLESAKELCGNWVEGGQLVQVGCRFHHDDPDGTKTKQIECVVGEVPEENVIFSREPPGFPCSDSNSESPLGNSLARKSSEGKDEFDQNELEELSTKSAAQFAVEWGAVKAKKEPRNRKRPAEDGDDRHHPARRTRTYKLEKLAA